MVTLTIRADIGSVERRPGSARYRRRQHLLELLPDILQRLGAAGGAAHRDRAFRRCDDERSKAPGPRRRHALAPQRREHDALPFGVLARFGDLATIEITIEP
jgi:hypothetical protein